MANVSQVGNVPDDVFISRAESAAQLAEDAAALAAAAQAAAEQALADTLAALAAQTLGDHADTTFGALAVDDNIQWNGSAWINAPSTFASHADVDLTGLATDDVAQYNGSQWVPVSLAAAAGAVPLAGGTMSGLLILSGPPTVADGAATKAYVDGLAGLTPPYDIGVFFNGVPGDSEDILRFKCVRAFRLFAGLSNSRAEALVAATAATTVSIRRNGVQVGTVNWAMGATDATFTLAADVDYAQDDTLELIAQATADATLEDISITLIGNLL